MTKQQQLHSIARKIIKENIYLTLATTDGNEVWAAPLFYCVDDTYTFYFISQQHSRHTRHIKKHPKAAFAIFDSHAAEGQGNGIQGAGTVRQVELSEVPKVLQTYHTTFIPMTLDSFRGRAPYRLFELRPTSFYILDPDTSTDKRIPVRL